MSTLVIVTPPAVEPIGLPEAKAHLRVDSAQDDALIASLIDGARQVAESLLGRAFITQTLRLLCDAAPERLFTLPRAPLQSVTHIKVHDDTDTAVTIDSSLYMIDTADSRISLRHGASWPTVSRAMNGFEVQYVAGYGASATHVPMALRRGLLAHVAHLYHHRGDGLTREGISQAMSAIPREALVLYAPYRIQPGIA